MSREMKDSGMEWIGKIPANWTLGRFQYLTTIYNGNSIKDDEKSNYEDVFEAIPYISSKDIDLSSNTIDYDNGLYIKKNDSKFKRAPSNSTLLCIEGGSAGKKVAFTNQEVCFVNKLCCIHSNIIVNKMLFYYILSPSFNQEFGSNLSGLIGGVTVGELKKIHLLIPPYNEQEAIIKHIDEKCFQINDVIDKNKRIIEEYKKLKQSIITEAVTKGIRKNRPMKDSRIEWIGDIPNNWFIVKIKNIATTSSGGTPNSSDHSLYDGDINWMCTYDLEEKPLFESKRKITEKGASQIAGSLQTKGTVLVSMYGGSSTIGKTGILECEARTNQAICSIKFDKQYVDNYYGFYYIQSIKNEWMRYAEGTRKDPNISQTIVNEMSFVVPPIEEQKEIVQYLNDKCITIDEIIKKKNTVIKELELYKKSIIYEYVTGKKEVQPTITCSGE